MCCGGGWTRLFSALSSASRSALPKSRCTPVISGIWRSLFMSSFSLPASLRMKVKALTVGRSGGVVGRDWLLIGIMVRVSMMPPAFLTFSTTSSATFCLGSRSVSADSIVTRRSNLPVIMWISLTSGRALNRLRTSCSVPGFVLMSRKLLNLRHRVWVLIASVRVWRDIRFGEKAENAKGDGGVRGAREGRVGIVVEIFAILKSRLFVVVIGVRCVGLNDFRRGVECGAGGSNGLRVEFSASSAFMSPNCPWNNWSAAGRFTVRGSNRTYRRVKLN